MSRSSGPNEALRQIEERYGALADRLPAVVFIWEAGVDGCCLYISPSIEEMLGFPQSEWLGQSRLWQRRVHPDDYERVVQAELDAMLTGTPLSIEYRLLARDGGVVWVRDDSTVVRDPDGRQPGLFYGVFTDVTERKRAEAEIEHLAMHDSLTGLPNRSLLLDRLRQTLSRAQRRPSMTAVLFLDIDRFKRINDGLGHSAGDQVLREVAARLTHALRPADTVARFGGDEFCMLCEDLEGVEEARAIADRIAQVLQPPLALEDGDLNLTASIGIALTEGDGADIAADALIRDADAAMYRAKERGRARAELFDATMRQQAVTRLEVEHALYRAIERQEFRLAFQPIVSLETGEVTGVEALLRWQHPERGLLTPGEFLTIAEDTGLIVPIGAWVIREACSHAERWRSKHNPELTLHVNLSARELSHPDLAVNIREAAKNPALLCLEVAESAAMDERHGGLDGLDVLRELEVATAIDDFGTGYTSLDQLRRLPVDALKIHETFVSGLVPRSRDSALVAGMLSMGRALEVQVIAEGVETPQQLGELRAVGCDHGQGHLFCPPVPPDELGSLLEADALPLSR